MNSEMWQRLDASQRLVASAKRLIEAKTEPLTDADANELLALLSTASSELQAVLSTCPELVRGEADALRP